MSQTRRNNSPKDTPRPTRYVVYDYETTGLSTRDLAAMQIGYAVTDGDFNVQNLRNITVTPALDRLVGPEAAAITKVDQSEWQRRAYNYQPGVNKPTRMLTQNDFSVAHTAENSYSMTETEMCYFFNEEILAQSNTCVVGYNNIRFDNKVTEFLFFRNFIDPWKWKWQNFNSSIDAYILAKAFFTICPSAINWPISTFANGLEKVSFKLEDIAKANGFNHANAHDALSDVEATIELLQHFSRAQPKQVPPDSYKGVPLHDVQRYPSMCLDYLLKYRNQKALVTLLESSGRSPMVYFNGYGKRVLNGAMPVLILNNFASQPSYADKQVYLLDLTARPEDIKAILALNEAELQAYLKMPRKARKFPCPIHVAKTNAFSLFCPPLLTKGNTNLWLDPVTNLVQGNISLVTANPNFTQFANLIMRFKGDQSFANQLPPESLSHLVASEEERKQLEERLAQQLLQETGEVQLEPEAELSDFDQQLAQALALEATTDKQKLKAQKRTQIADWLKQNPEQETLLFPDTKLNDVIGDLFSNQELKGVFGDKAWYNPERFVSLYNKVANHAVFNNLLILFMGNNGYFEYMGHDATTYYFEMMEKRRSFYEEDFHNQCVDMLERLHNQPDRQEKFDLAAVAHAKQAAQAFSATAQAHIAGNLELLQNNPAALAMANDQARMLRPAYGTMTGEKKPYQRTAVANPGAGNYQGGYNKNYQGSGRNYNNQQGQQQSPQHNQQQHQQQYQQQYQQAGFNQQGGFAGQQTGGFAQQGGFNQQGGFAGQQGGFANQQPQSGFAGQQGGFANQQPQSGFAGQQGGFANQQPQSGFAGQQGGFANQQPQGGFAGQQQGGFNQQGGFSGQSQQGGFAGQQTQSNFAGQQTGGFANQQPQGGFAGQQQGGFAHQQQSGFSQQGSFGGHQVNQSNQWSQGTNQAAGWGNQQAGWGNQQNTFAGQNQPAQPAQPGYNQGVAQGQGFSQGQGFTSGQGFDNANGWNGNSGSGYGGFGGGYGQQ